MATTGAKATSVEAVLDALRQHPDATAAELAEHAGIGRSTATRTLVNLETKGQVTRQRGKAEAGGRTAPDRWALVPDTHTDPDETQQPATEKPAAEPTSKDSSSQRLRPGELRALLHAWLAERPGQEFTPTKIGKELGRSAGAVGNALATMTDADQVTKTSAKPRKYMLAPQPGEAADTGGETAKAS